MTKYFKNSTGDVLINTNEDGFIRVQTTHDNISLRAVGQPTNTNSLKEIEEGEFIEAFNAVSEAIGLFGQTKKPLTPAEKAAATKKKNAEEKAAKEAAKK